MKTKSSRQIGKSCPCELIEFCNRQSDQQILEFAQESKECHRLLKHRYQYRQIESYVHSASHREISDKLDIPIGMVGTLIARGRRMLHEHLERKRSRFSSDALAG